MHEKTITPSDIKLDAKKNQHSFEPIPHAAILKKLMNSINQINFRKLAELETDNEKLTIKHVVVITIEEILKLAKQNNWGLCKHHERIYLYNGSYWKPIGDEEIQAFLGEAAEKMGIYKFEARHYGFRDKLYQQFLATANLPKPENASDSIVINLKNGTFVVTPEKQYLRQPDRADFLTHQLNFEYSPKAEAPLFIKFLDEVQPDKDCQKVLAEYIGYLFIKASILKLEKALLLYGIGANGKSVFFDIVNALLGQENVSNFSLQNLTNDTGYYRAMLENKLANYASEINRKLEASVFKQLVSGEPVSARLPHGHPFTVSNYGKLIFNCNELPREVENTHAFFRRFLIVPFKVTIPEGQQDKELAKKIIQSELPGVFNWVLEGLQRLVIQKGFTNSQAVEDSIRDYKIESDTVQLFLLEKNYMTSIINKEKLSDMHRSYMRFCELNGSYPCSNTTFAQRLRNAGYKVERRSIGNVVYVEKKSFLEASSASPTSSQNKTTV